MRRFEIKTPVAIDKEGITEVEGDFGAITLGLTDDDVEDLNNGLSITTLTTQGEEVALFPYTKNVNDPFED